MVLSVVRLVATLSHGFHMLLPFVHVLYMYTFMYLYDGVYIVCMYVSWGLWPNDNQLCYVVIVLLYLVAPFVSSTPSGSTLAFLLFEIVSKFSQNGRILDL